MTEIPKGHGKWHGGKGSARKDSDNTKYADNWDKIFGKDKGLSEREKVCYYYNILNIYIR